MTATAPTTPALEPRAGRRCHNALNPLHSVVYFSSEYDRELTALGLERGAMAYFAGRAAPLGAVAAGTVTATFYNFNHAIIAPVIPRAWGLAPRKRSWRPGCASRTRC